MTILNDQYEQLDEIIDDVAERIRSLGHYAPATLKDYLGLTHLTEHTCKENDSQALVRELLFDHESIIIRLRQNISHLSDDLKDFVTSDFLIKLLGIHERIAWMLRTH